MNELLPRLERSDKEKKELFERLADLWRLMRFYPEYDMDGEIIGGETIIADVVENLADQPKPELPRET